MEKSAQLRGVHGFGILLAFRVLEEYLASQSVAVEMDHVERLALRLGRAQTLGQLFEGGWPQNFQMERLSRRISQPANQMARYRAERHSVVFEAADRQQDANFASGGPWGVGL